MTVTHAQTYRMRDSKITLNLEAIADKTSEKISEMQNGPPYVTYWQVVSKKTIDAAKPQVDYRFLGREDKGGKGHKAGRGRGGGKGGQKAPK